MLSPLQDAGNQQDRQSGQTEPAQVRDIPGLAISRLAGGGRPTTVHFDFDGAGTPGPSFSGALKSGRETSVPGTNVRM